MPRANWKGQLKIEQFICPVALYTATSTTERVSFNMVNRKTGHRLNREFVDSDTGEVVPREEQIKGYETPSGDYVSFDASEIAAAYPGSDKTITVSRFVSCNEIDDIYLDRPYYLAPDKDADESFVLIREGLRTLQAAALADAVLFRRNRRLLIRAFGEGLVAATLNFDYEVRAAAESFEKLAAFDFDEEMLDLATHIIATKRGTFDPRSFDDRYDTALAEVVKAKIEGKPLKRAPIAKEAKIIDLKDALRKSAALAASKDSAATRTKPASTKRKAG